jgi:HD-GYP domain-containing protein (c-di-GMP phosphodiesterase class II)
LEIIIFGRELKFVEECKNILQAFLNLNVVYWLEKENLEAMLPEALGSSRSVAVTIIDPAMDTRNVFHILDNMNNYQKGVPVVVFTADENFFRSELIGSKFQEVHNFFTLDFTWSREEILTIRSCVQDILSEHPNVQDLPSMNKPIDEDFFSIRIQNFYRFKSVPTDLYCKRGDDVYTKLIPANEDIGKERVRNLISKKVKEFYLLKDGHLKFVNFCVNDLTECFQKGFESVKERHVAQLQTYNITYEQLKVIGATEQLLNLNRLMLKSSIEMVNKNTDFYELIIELGQLNFEYRFEHSLLTAYVCYGVVHYLDWKSGIGESKLSLACMLHDITLPNDKLARIKGLDDPAFKNLTEEEQEIYRNHPQDAAEIIKNYHGFPLELQFIVFDHHERPDGSGFPSRKHSGAIAPLSCVFIMCHDFVNMLYDTEFSEDGIVNALVELQGKYRGKHFHKALESLFKMFALPFEAKRVI